MLAFLRFELVRSVRDVVFLVFFIGFPLLLYLVYGRDDAVLQGSTFRSYFLVSMASFAVAGLAMSTTGTQLATERANGWLRQLGITPLSGRAWLGAKILHGLVLVTPGLLALALAGVLYGQVRLDASQWAALAAVLVPAAMPFILIGLAIGLSFTARAAQVVHTVVLFGLLFLSGILIPWPQLPAIAQVIGSVLPLHHVAALGWEITGTAPVGWAHVVVIAAWTAALGIGVLVLRRREFAADR